ncbi:MAG TPA: hypothetical protein VNQ52_04280 [Microbacteriaceae bacterium]|nr:hypothetical protein [Microbacteriaceae bacterium]
MTDRVVDSVEKKVNEVTTVVSDALGSAADAIHRAASDDSKPKKSKHK